MRSPAARQAELVSQVVEDVLIRIAKLRRKVDRSNPVTRLESALETLSELAASAPNDANHLTLLDTALEATRNARIAFDDNEPTPEGEPLSKRLFAAQRALEHVRDLSIEMVVAVQDSALDEAHHRTADPSCFLGSDGAARLQWLEREPVASGVEVVAPDEWVFDDIDSGQREMRFGERTDDDDDLLKGNDEGLVEDFVGDGPDEPDAAKRLQLLVPIGADPLMAHGLDGELAQLERIATQCLEDIGVLGNLRRVDDDKPFVAEAVERFERRMLSNVDAALSLGTAFEIGTSVGGRFSSWTVLEHAINWAKDSVMPDPGRAFARTYLLCSVGGRDTLRAAVLSLKQSHPMTYPMHAEAFALAPNPGIDEAMLALCNDDDPQLCAMASTVLAMRGYAATAQVQLLLEHSNRDVRVAAARCAAKANDEPARQAAIATLIDFVERELDDDVSLAAIETLVLLGSVHGLKFARERIREDADEPGSLQRRTCDRLMQLVAVAGGGSDSELLCDAYRGHVGAARALGRHGHIDAIPSLIDAFAGAESGMLAGQQSKLAAAAALVRITGAVEQPHPHLGLAPVPLPTTAKFWMDWWSTHQSRFDRKVRYRFGRPYTPLQSIDEIEQVEVVNRERNLCALELAIIPGTPWLRINDFVTRQNAQLRDARLVVEEDLASGTPRQPPGAWASSHLR